ncbi:MAG: hypothetical protein QG671_3641 [Actinomycetota bacterium]|nr:hypothetical protein [Actinomycetota bacterium]
MDIESRLGPVLAVAAANAAAVDTEGVFPAASVAELRRSGLLGLTIPTDEGGLGAGPEVFSEVVSRLAEVCGSTAMIYLMHIAGTMPIAAAPPSAYPNLLSELADGTRLATLAFSEKGSRSHFWAPMSRAEVSADGIRLNAEKSWVTSAGFADVYLVSTQTAEAASPTESDLFVVLGDDPGATVGPRFTGLGLRGNESSPMRFDTLVHDSERVGDVGSGFATMMGVVLPWFNLGNASVTLGLAKSALDAAVRHVSGANLAHLDSRLADLPTIRHRIGKAGILLAAQREYLAATARKIANPADDTLMYVLGARASVNDAALEITDQAMRVCGGAAFSKHLPIERNFRDARAGHVMAPTSDVLYDFYGKAMCGMELF